MRLWSIHPSYLDTKALVACWREGLLARKVLQGATIGYRNHPQLDSFKEQVDPLGTIDTYLLAIYEEANKRGYKFKRDKIAPQISDHTIEITDGQLKYEFSHLKKKLKIRDREKYDELTKVRNPESHPMFHIISGEPEKWERLSANISPQE